VDNPYRSDSESPPGPRRRYRRRICLGVIGAIIGAIVATLFISLFMAPASWPFSGRVKTVTMDLAILIAFIVGARVGWGAGMYISTV
jgi:hypothetical protein